MPLHDMTASLSARLRASLVLLAAAAAAPTVALADDTPWLVRVRAVQLDSADKDTTGLGLSIDDKVIPEVDVSYFFTPSFAVELVLTSPQKLSLNANGAGIGTLKALPPTLTAQYHVTGFGAFKPYVGAGLNLTRFSDVRFDPAVQAALQPSVDRTSVGWALQAGLDWTVGPNVVVNIDVKKVRIRTDVTSAGTTVGEFRVDPWLFGVGAGWTF